MGEKKRRKAKADADYLASFEGKCYFPFMAGKKPIPIIFHLPDPLKVCNIVWWSYIVLPSRARDWTL